jgi:3-oxoacyl-[acyl-carrier protein] reductase
MSLGARLDGHVAIVTGGSGGVGRAVCAELAARGADVCIVGRDAERLRAATRTVEAAGGRAPLALALDVRDPHEMREMADAALERFGGIDALVACAGVGSPSRSGLPKGISQLGCDDWDAVLETNLRGTFLSNRAVLPSMLERGSGDIVNISSFPAGIRGQPFAAAYSASKFGVAAFSEGLAREVEDRGIRVHVLFPGLVDTAMVDGTSLGSRFGPAIPPERVAAAIAFLVTLHRDSRISGADPVVLRG